MFTYLNSLQEYGAWESFMVGQPRRLVSEVSTSCGKSSKRGTKLTEAWLGYISGSPFILSMVDFLHVQKESGTVKGNTSFDVANSLSNSSDFVP